MLHPCILCVQAAATDIGQQVLESARSGAPMADAPILRVVTKHLMKVRRCAALHCAVPCCAALCRAGGHVTAAPILRAVGGTRRGWGAALHEAAACAALRARRCAEGEGAHPSPSTRTLHACAFTLGQAHSEGVDRFVMDGFPRNVAQARALRLLLSLPCMLCLPWMRGPRCDGRGFPQRGAGARAAPAGQPCSCQGGALRARGVRTGPASQVSLAVASHQRSAVGVRLCTGDTQAQALDQIADVQLAISLGMRREVDHRLRLHASPVVEADLKHTAQKWHAPWVERTAAARRRLLARPPLPPRAGPALAPSAAALRCPPPLPALHRCPPCRF